MVAWKPDWKPQRHDHAFVLSEADLEAYPCWYLDAAHAIPPWTPLFAWTWTHHQRYGDLWAADTMGLPTCRGTDWREVDGCAYMSPILVTDPQEKEARQVRFRKHLQPFVKNYDAIWRRVVAELTRNYDRFKAFDPEQATEAALYDHFEAVFRFNYRVWGLHSWMMYTLFAFYTLFEDLCQDYAGINDTSVLWHRLIRGFENKMLQVDRQLWQLSDWAVALGLEDVIKNTEDSQVIPALEQSDAGHNWLHDQNGFFDFIEAHGWRMPRMMELSSPSYMEQPTQLFPFIRQCFEKPRGMEDPASRSEMIEDRKDAEAETLSKFPSSQRGWVRKLMSLTQKTGIFTEGHNYYFEHPSHALMRRAALACVKRMVRRGFVEDPEDFVFLLPGEFRKNTLSLCLDYRPLIAERKAHFRAYSQRMERPPLIGRLSDKPQEAMRHVMAARDHVMMKVTLGGHVNWRLDVEADLLGNPAAPGLGEGRVRIITFEGDIRKIQAGDILVAVTTYSSWTPIFPLIKGVVLDSGASLSHAAIVGREYKIPVVVQTKNATRLLKDGQHIKVDGYRGAVWIVGETGHG
jgi:phosphohistidine swiveling domain-containing protein